MFCRTERQRRAAEPGDDELLCADDMAVQPLDDEELNALLKQAYLEHHAADEAPTGGAFQMLLFEGIDLQQELLSPEHVPVVVAAPAVPTLGAEVVAGQAVAPGSRFDPASLVASVTSQFGQ